MAIPKFTTFTSGAVPVEAENIDTDQIIPARFLKATERKGFGDNLFRDWRYDAEGRPIAAFPLNDPRYEGRILVAGRNFGCGSFDDLRRDPASRFTVDLEAQTLTALSDGRSERFEIDAYKKKCLLNGYDDVDYLLSIADRIEAFEASRR